MYSTPITITYMPIQNTHSELVVIQIPPMKISNNPRPKLFLRKPKLLKIHVRDLYEWKIYMYYRDSGTYLYQWPVVLCLDREHHIRKQSRVNVDDIAEEVRQYAEYIDQF